MLLPVCHHRIVARFGCEGKPDNARKSRIFNNLGRSLGGGPVVIFRTRRTRASLRQTGLDCRPCGMRRGYDSHSPDKVLSHLTTDFRPKTGSRTASQERFHD
jgi:hypothetical protein